MSNFALRDIKLAVAYWGELSPVFATCNVPYIIVIYYFDVLKL